MYYTIAVLISVAAIIFANFCFASFSLTSFLYISLHTVLTTAGVILLDAIGALSVRRLVPSKWVSPQSGLYQVSKRERDFYQKIKIKAWKDKVPELGATTGFKKSSFNINGDTSYLERFVMENNYGMLVHIENMIMGALICLIPYYDGASLIVPGRLGIWLPVFLVNFVLNLLPLFILRYTNYTLVRLYKREQKRKEQSKVMIPDNKAL